MSEHKVIIKADKELSKVRRCELIDVARSTAYCEAVPVSDDDLITMRLIDEIHLRLPFSRYRITTNGSRRIRDELHINRVRSSFM